MLTQFDAEKKTQTEVNKLLFSHVRFFMRCQSLSGNMGMETKQVSDSFNSIQSAFSGYDSIFFFIIAIVDKRIKSQDRRTQ